MQDSPAVVASPAAAQQHRCCGGGVRQAAQPQHPVAPSAAVATRRLFSEEAEDVVAGGGGDATMLLASAWSSSAAVLEQALLREDKATASLSPRTPVPDALNRGLTTCPTHQPYTQQQPRAACSRQLPDPASSQACRALPGLAPADASELSHLRAWLTHMEGGLKASGRAIVV